MIPRALAANAASNTANETTSGIQMLLTNIVDFIPLFIAAFIVFIISYLIARYTRNLVVKAIYRTGAEDADQIAKLFGGLVYMTLLLIGLSVSMNIVHVDISFIIGSMTFALGFSLKDIISNYLAGAMILLQKPFHVGDVIKVGDQLGVVKNVSARTTALRSFDGEEVIIPNSDVFSSRIIDMNSYAERRSCIEVGVAYETNIENCTTLLLNIADNHPDVLKFPKPTVVVESFGDSAVNLVLKYWFSSKGNLWDIKSTLTQTIHSSFADNHITIPFPIRTIENRQDVSPGDSITRNPEAEQQYKAASDDANKVADIAAFEKSQ